jgi:dienelactone hydrolase
MLTDSSLPSHTIYAPKSAPNVTMPFIAFGNGGCSTDGAGYKNLLVELASYGYVIAADGPPGGSGGAQSKVSDMRASIDWAVKGGAAKYGKIDLDQIATAGHSCGGLEAMSTAYHDSRVKRIVLFNIAIFQDDRRYLLSEIKVPVAWFVGGPKDMGYPNVRNFYATFLLVILCSFISS